MENFNEIEGLNKCNEFKGLKQFYNDIITKHPNLIFESEDITSLQETALISILEKDKLQLAEIKICYYVIEWGIAQKSTLPTNFEKWSKENFKNLKITLQQCLPLIRYFHISSKDVREKLKPIISNPELYQRINEPISTIINEKQVAEISLWIDRKSIIYSLQMYHKTSINSSRK
ncbi:hypothetical protein Glove_91g18 [Diversispora epigaea]|uniref:BACK domain-containing protein n=1 Tax=Diversispora epigaea TaxID=1348612 RepID=A0A397J5I2_9GLOM|nr:hypothetical protein Glove_91g18 [Diversispora epigaea]